MLREFKVDKVGGTLVCRDWEKVYQVRGERFRVWKELTTPTAHDDSLHFRRKSVKSFFEPSTPPPQVERFACFRLDKDSVAETKSFPSSNHEAGNAGVHAPVPIFAVNHLPAASTHKYPI